MQRALNLYLIAVVDGKMSRQHLQLLLHRAVFCSFIMTPLSPFPICDKWMEKRHIHSVYCRADSGVAQIVFLFPVYFVKQAGKGQLVQVKQGALLCTLALGV